MDTVKSQLVMLNQDSHGDVNYVPWRLKLDVVMKTKKMYDIATGVKPQPAGAADTPDVKAWVEKDLEAQQLIVLNVSDQIAYKIANCHSAKQMLEKLVQLYGTKTEMTMEILRRQFFTYMFDESKSVIENCMELLSIGEQLGTENDPVRDSWMMSRILSMLPPRLAHFGTSWDNVTGANKNSTTMIERLRLEDERQTSQNKGQESTSTNALIAERYNNKKSQGKSTNKNEKNGPVCYKCGLKGHVKRDCKNKPCAKYLEYCKENYDCNSCGQKGHFSKECPHRGNNNNDTKKKPSVWLTVSLKTSDLDSSPDRLEEKSTIWFQDSGASQHMTSHRDWFTEFNELRRPMTILLGDSTEIDGVGVGTVELEAFDGNEWHPIILKDVVYVPELKFNLFSVSHMLDQGYVMKSDKDRAEFLKADKMTTVGVAKRHGNLYAMRLRREKRTPGMAAISIRTWHERMAHQNVKYVRDVLKRRGIKFVDDWNNYCCEGCDYGKHHCESHPANEKIAKQSLDLVHVDMGEMREPSLGGAKYYLVFKDDFSHFRTVYFMKTKNEAPDKLKLFVKMAENQLGRKMKCLRSDNGKEIRNAATDKFLTDLGIFHTFTNPHTPQQNGRIEREMRTIVEAARSALTAANLSIRLWAEAVSYAVFTINQTGTSTVKGKTPAELWFGRQMDLNKLRTFGCECYVLLPEHKRGKFDRKSEKGYLVGYDLNSPTYRVYIPGRRDIVSEANVNYNEEYERSKTEVVTETSAEKPNEESAKEESETETDEYDIGEDEVEEKESAKDEEAETRKRPVRPTRGILPKRYENSVMWYSRGISQEDTVLLGAAEDITVSEALKDSNWRRAMEEEYKSLVDRKTWKLVKCPEGVKPLTCRWVLTEKSNGKLKARLVARGFEQQQGIDYEETFSPVASYASIRLILSHVASEKWKLIAFDVKTAFLYGKLKEVLHMVQPEGFEDGTGNVCQLSKAIYGLKQAPKQWNKEITSSFEEMGLESSDDDPCVFYNKNKTIILALFVDDGLVAGKDEKEIFELLKKIGRKFEITHSKTFQNQFTYLGMELKIDSKGIFVNQLKYTQKILKRMGMENCNPAPTPIEPGMIAESHDFPNDEKVPAGTPYREAIGSLLYLATISRPDISYAVSYLSRQCCDPKKSHWKMTKRVFQYLKATPEAGIYFGGDREIKVYTDADFGGEKESMKSTSGGLILRGGPIVWYSLRQKVVSTSTAEAEYRAVYQVIDDVCWLKRLALELGIMKEDQPIPMFVDNKSAVHMLQNTHEGKLNKGKKHIEILRKFIKYHTEETVSIEHIEGKKQIADIFTKPLSKVLFNLNRSFLIKEEC